MKDYQVFLFTIILVIGSLVFIIPNLSTDISKYKSVTKILESTRIEKKEEYKKFTNRTKFTLIMLMTDQTHWHIDDQYSEYWDKLQNINNIGKEVKIYPGNNTSHFYNPVQIEIDNEVIYDPSANLKWAYLLLTITLFMIVFSGIRIKKYLN